MLPFYQCSDGSDFCHECHVTFPYLYDTSSKKQTGDVITFAQFEEGNLLSETRNDTESDDESDNESIMMSDKYMENIEEKEKFDDDLISTETLHDIRDRNQTHLSIDKRDARLEIRDHIKQKKSQWRGTLRDTHKMGKCLHRVFSTIVSEISQELTNFGETGKKCPILYQNLETLLK